MSVPNGRGSGLTANPTTNQQRNENVLKTAQRPGRRVRHQVGDAMLLAVVSLTLSAGAALLLSLFSHLVGAA